METTKKTTCHFLKISSAAMAAVQIEKAKRLEKGERLKTEEMASELILRGANA